MVCMSVTDGVPVELSDGVLLLSCCTCLLLEILTNSLPLIHHQTYLTHVSVREAATPSSPACCCGAAQTGQSAACLCPLLRLDAA